MSSRPKRKPAPAARIAGYKPWAAVTLCVDAGEKCGVAIYDHGIYWDSGYGDGYDASWIQMWICSGAFVAEQRELPLVLVLEKPPAGGRAFPGRSPAGPASVIGSRKLWRKQWNKNADTVNRYVVDVYPPSWRGPVLGTVINPQPRERLRAAVEKHNDARRAEQMEPNEAAAICIGVWSSNAPDVAAVLPRKLRQCAL